jgi:excinuclease UvrABC ATPase subunit
MKAADMIIDIGPEAGTLVEFSRSRNTYVKSSSPFLKYLMEI